MSMRVKEVWYTKGEKERLCIDVHFKKNRKMSIMDYSILKQGMFQAAEDFFFLQSKDFVKDYNGLFS